MDGEGRPMSAFARVISALSAEANHGPDFVRRQAAYGIGWSIETGRSGAYVVEAIAAMDRDAIDALIDEARDACPTIGDVPRWLNARFA
jgi:hypothetical protein